MLGLSLSDDQRKDNGPIYFSFFRLSEAIRRTQLLLPPALNMAFRFIEPQIVKPFPNEKLLKKKKIAATEQTTFSWETALRFTVQ